MKLSWSIICDIIHTELFPRRRWLLYFKRLNKSDIQENND